MMRFLDWIYTISIATPPLLEPWHKLTLIRIWHHTKDEPHLSTLGSSSPTIAEAS